MRAEAALSQARTNLSYTEIKAPFAGRIGDNACRRGRAGRPRGRTACHPSSSLIRSMEFPVPTAELQDFLDQVKGDGLRHCRGHARVGPMVRSMTAWATSTSLTAG